MSFIITGKKPIFSLAAALSFCFIARGYIDNLLGVMLFNLDLVGASTSYILLLAVLFFIAIAIAVPHELLHGLMYRLFGGKVTYGLRLRGAYALETSGVILHRSKFLLMLLAPVTVISAATAVMPIAIGGITFVLNLLGSIPDLLIAMQLLRTNEHSYVKGENNGFFITNCKNTK